MKKESENITKYLFYLISIIKSNLILIEIIIIFLLSFLLLLLSRKINYDELNNLLHSLITITGIFSGIIISVLSIKIFQIKEKKETLFKEYYELSRKLMFFRRICYEIKSSIQFWKTFDDIKWFEREYKDISFNDIHSPSRTKGKKSSYSFWLSGDLKISESKADLYLSLKQIVNDKSAIPNWILNKETVCKNSIEYLNNVLMPSNQIWYYLDYKYKKHIEGEISFEDLNIMEINQLQQYISELDPQFKNKEINRKLIAQIASKFYENYIPSLIEVTKDMEISFPRSILGLFLSMLLLIATGVIAPILILLFVFSFKTIIIATSILIFLYIFEIIIFFRIFYNFIKTELKFI